MLVVGNATQDISNVEKRHPMNAMSRCVPQERPILWVQACFVFILGKKPVDTSRAMHRLKMSPYLKFEVKR